MLDLPENDRALTSNPRQGHRHLQLVTPYAYDEPYPSEAIDDRPLDHPEFTFVVRSDVEGRNDQPVQLIGTLEALKDALHGANTTARNAIFAELDPATCILAEVRLRPYALDVALPVPPSIIVDEGRTADGWCRRQWLWLLTRPATPEQREAIVAALLTRGAHVPEGRPLIRLAGFFSRFDEPQLVTAMGSPEHQGQVAVRLDPAQLARVFAGEMAPIE
jgi:hypothetical protein